jgi:membrane protease YdiL (CAAX protease family)
MSNALLLAATTLPASAPAQLPPEVLSEVVIVTLSLGVITFIIAAGRAILRPSAISLAKTPGRPNTLTLPHVALVFLLWIGVQELGNYLLCISYSLPWPIKEAALSLVEKSSLMKVSVLVGLVATAVLGACSLIVARGAFSHGLTRGMGLRPRHWLYDSMRAVVACLMVFPLCLGLLALTNMIFISLHHEDWTRQHMLLTAIMDLGVSWKILTFLTAGLMAPIAEELFFRGLVQSLLRRCFGDGTSTGGGRPWLAIIVTSVFFAAMHAGAPNTVASIFVLALALGYLYERSGRLTGSIVLHVVFNIANLLMVMA